MPDLYLIAGSNGAGKSSTGADYLPAHIRERCKVFDGDKLFVDKQHDLWRSGIIAIKEAKKLAFAFVKETFEALVEEALTNRNDFVYEGHFTNEATWDIPRRFRLKAYGVHMIYLGLTDTNLSNFRVLDRSKEGGHYVDPVTVSNNFYGNLEKLNQHFALFDTLQIIDTSETQHKLLAVFANGNPQSFLSEGRLPQWFTTHLPNLVQKMK